MKLSLKDIYEMQRGEHSSQKKKVFGAPVNTEQTKHREVGEVWEELDAEGNVLYIWEQKKGYRVKKSPNLPDFKITDELLNYPNCYADCKLRETKAYGRLDEKFRKIYGMCSECSAKLETKLKMSGEWAAYERKRMLDNAKSFFHEMDDAVKQTLERMRNVEFVNETGRVEKWDASTQEERTQALENEYQTYKTLILEALEGKRTDVVVE